MLELKLEAALERMCGGVAIRCGDALCGSGGFVSLVSTLVRKHRPCSCVVVRAVRVTCDKLCPIHAALPEFCSQRCSRVHNVLYSVLHVSSGGICWLDLLLEVMSKACL